MLSGSRYAYVLYPWLVALACAGLPSTIAAPELPLPPSPVSSPSDGTAAANGLDAPAPAGPSPAQTAPAPPSTTAGPPVSRERSFFKDLLADEKAIWTSPRRIRPRDAAWLAPLGAATGVLIVTDRRASRELRHQSEEFLESDEISPLGSGYATFGAAGTLYALGRLRHNDRAQEAGLLGVEALIHSSIVVSGLKLVTNRERPTTAQGQGRFWTGGKSFPSGHAIHVWSFATVLAYEYPNQPLVRYGAYGLATAVGLSRFTGRYHFPSDVLVGSALGYLIGRYVVRHHAKPHPSRVPASTSP